MRLQRRLSRTERSAPRCPDCTPQVMRIIEEVVDHPDNITPTTSLFHAARTDFFQGAQCRFAHEPILILAFLDKCWNGSFGRRPDSPQSFDDGLKKSAS